MPWYFPYEKDALLKIRVMSSKKPPASLISLPFVIILVLLCASDESSEDTAAHFTAGGDYSFESYYLNVYFVYVNL